MKKRILAFLSVFALTLICLGASGLALSASAAVPDGSSSSSSLEEKVYMDITNAAGFSDGVAWAESRSNNKWNIINKDGDVVKEFDDVYSVIANFTNGYSIVSTNDSFYVINTSGDIIINGKELGCREVYNYAGLADGSIIAIKKLDDFDKSGDYYYHYDLKNNVETELGACKDDNNWYYFTYCGNGYYTITNNQGYSYNSSEYSMKIAFYNYITGDSFDLTDDSKIKSEIKNANIRKWEICKLKDTVFLSVTADNSYDRVGFKIDTKSKKCSPLSDLNGKELERNNKLDVGVDSYFDDLIVVNAGYNNNPYCSDLSTGKTVEFAPNADYECKIYDYEDSRFLVTTRNENGTNFYTVLGWDMKPLFSPKRLSDNTKLIGSCVVTEEEDGSVTITDVAQKNKVLATVQSAAITYYDYTNNYVWVTTESGTTECYSIADGSRKATFDAVRTISSDTANGLVLTNADYTYSFYKLDDGSQLEIVEDIIYHTEEESSATSSSSGYAYATTSEYYDYSSNSGSTWYDEDEDIYDDFWGGTSSSSSSDDSLGELDDLLRQFGLSGISGDDLNEFDILSALYELSGDTGRVILLIALLVAICGCFFGFKLMKVYIAICALFIGGLSTIIATAYQSYKDEGNAVIVLLLGLILTIVLTIFAYKFYKIGVFIVSFRNGLPIGLLLGLLMFQKEWKPILLTGVLVGLIVGVVSVIFTKPSIIFSTSINYGQVAGVYLAILISSKTMYHVAPILFIIAGIFVQQYSNNGLFEGALQEKINKSTNPVLKILQSRKPQLAAAGAAPGMPVPPAYPTAAVPAQYPAAPAQYPAAPQQPVTPAPQDPSKPFAPPPFVPAAPAQYAPPAQAPNQGANNNNPET